MRKSDKTKKTTGIAAGCALAWALATTCAPTVDASLLLEEGFAAGGATPSVNQYRNSPDSTDGKNNNSLHGQGPGGATGFNQNVAWQEMSGTASFVYPKALSTGLTYTDTLGNILITSEGAADWHRDTSGSGAKMVRRPTNLAYGEVLPSTAYFSALMRFTDGLSGKIGFNVRRDDEGDERRVVFGFESTGAVMAGTESGLGTPTTTTKVVSVATFLPDTTHLVFGKVTDDGGNDMVSLWVNPLNLADPMAGTPTLTGSIGNGWVVAANYTIAELQLTANLVGGDQFIYDEIRLGSTVDDAISFIPEPSTALLGLLGLVGLAIRRKR